MSRSFRISLHKCRDAWNWYDASRHVVSHGFDWHNNLRYRFLDKYNEFISLPPRESRLQIAKFLDEIYMENKVLYSANKKALISKMSAKFDESCAWLEKATGKKLFFDNYQIFLTTFPRSPYNYNKGYFGLMSIVITE